MRTLLRPVALLIPASALAFTAVGCASSSSPGESSAVGAKTPVAGPADLDEPSLVGAVRDSMNAHGIHGAVLVFDAATGEPTIIVETPSTDMPTPSEARVHPASSVKPLVTLRALDAGTIGADFEHECDGKFDHEGIEFTCFDAHGTLDLKTGLATSCNEIAYAIGTRLGADSLRAGFEEMGFELDADEMASWAGDLAPALATGHGPLRVSPRVLGRAYVTEIARGRGPHRDLVVEGMVAAVEDPRGSARAAAVDDLRVAAKTGTSEGSGPGKYDSWLVAMAPADDPRVVLIVFSHDGDMAPTAAAPVAGEILRAWHAEHPADAQRSTPANAAGER